MSPLTYTWVFRLNPLDVLRCYLLHETRCVVHGDYQDPHFDFDPNATYAPVAPHESMRLLHALAAQENLIVEGGDASNAYLYGKIDFPILMEQPADSSFREAKTDHVCELLRSTYGLRQAVKL